MSSATKAFLSEKAIESRLKNYNSKHKKLQLLGQRFGKLVVIKDIPYGWLCKCDCGGEKAVNGSHLKWGQVTSCGCRFNKINKVDVRQVVKMYAEDKIPIRQIGKILDVPYARISILLIRQNFQVRRGSKPIKNKTTVEERRVMQPWKVYSNISRMRNVPRTLLEKYTDVNKLAFLCQKLNSVKSPQVVAPTPEDFIKYLDKFYFEEHFNRCYDMWIASGKQKMYCPSLDHIQPTSRDGGYGLDNLQILTWYENKSKYDMTQSEWESFRRATKSESILFKPLPDATK